jgi:hypothetical protein
MSFLVDCSLIHLILRSLNSPVFIVEEQKIKSKDYQRSCHIAVYRNMETLHVWYFYSLQLHGNYYNLSTWFRGSERLVLHQCEQDFLPFLSVHVNMTYCCSLFLACHLPSHTHFIPNITHEAVIFPWLPQFASSNKFELFTFLAVISVCKE